MHEFLNCSLEDQPDGIGDSSTRTECHFQLLAFLWHLQHSPQSSQHKFTPQRVQTTESIDTTDWHKLLLEDLDELVRDDYGGQTSSEDEFEDDDESRDTSELTSRSYPKTSSVSLTAYTNNTGTTRAVGDLSLELGILTKNQMQITDPEELDKWLRSRIHSEYWNSPGFEGLNVSSSKSCHRAMQFKRDWDAFVSEARINASSDLSKLRVLLKEEQVIREILWMLSGAEESFLFKLECHPTVITKHRYVVKGNVTVADVANDSIDNLLATAAHYGSMCASMRSMATYVRQHLDAVNTPEEKMPRTVYAFVSQLQVVLMHFQRFVHKLEEEVREVSTHTILELFVNLRPWFRRLGELYSLVHHVTAGRFETLHWESTVVLLIDALFNLLCSHWASRFDDEQLQMLSDFFVNTLEPYLASMDTLLAGCQYSSGTSARSELFLAKRNDVSRKDAAVYWRDAFTLKYYAGKGQILRSVPQILHPFVQRLIVTVKSMDFLIVIAEEKAMPELVKEIAVAPGAFVAGFSVSTAWLRAAGEEETLSHLSPAMDASHCSQDLRLGHFDIPEFTDNPLLRRALQEALPGPLPSSPRHPARRSSPPAIQTSTIPLRLLLQRSLRRLVSDRHRAVSRHLLTVLLDRLQLRRVLAQLCDVFLLRRGDLLDDLTRHLFARMRWPGAPWREALPLNLLLHQCLLGAGFGTDEAHRFWLTVDAVPGPGPEFDALTLHFQPPWPLEVVLAADSMALYAAVLRFLLQLRRVKAGLEALQFSALERLRSAGGRLAVLRVKVLHVVNSLHQFLMHRIIHAAVEDFNQRLDGEVDDLVDLCTLHRKFVRRVHRCCLLADKAEVFRKAFVRVAQLGVALERVWLSSGDGGVAEEMLSRMEEQFGDYTRFLSGVFRKAVRSAEFQYLEPLAMALEVCGETVVGEGKKWR